MTLIQKGTRAAELVATAEEFLQSDHESVADYEEVKEDDKTLDREKHERDITEWISWPHKPPSSNKDEEAEVKEEYASATKASI